jgi:hypothetical protein
MYLELDNATVQELLSALDDTEKAIELAQQERTAILEAIAAYYIKDLAANPSNPTWALPKP